MAAAPLATAGGYHAWLSAAGDTLNVTGPTGYGFSLRGNWTKVVSGSAIIYAATGMLYLRTPFLAQAAGEIALQVAARQTFKVTADTAGLAQLGELTGVSGHFGLSLAPVAAEVKRVFGLDVSTMALADGWTIKTGAQIRHDYQSYVRHDIGQLLDGVPYLVYGQAGKLKMQFGGVSVTSDNQSKLVLIADPADPFLYVGYKQYAAAGSLNGHIPFHATVAPTDPLSPAHGGTEFYGQVYAAGTYPLAGLPFNVNGDVTADLDANGDGQYLAGAGNASQLFHGDLRALDAVVRDINVGVNGGVNLSYSVANHTITHDIGAGGTISTPVGTADVTGSIGFDGNFHWMADGGIAIGGGGNYLRGDVSLKIDKVGGTFSVTAALDAQARLSIPGFKAEGDVTGTLKVVRGANRASGGRGGQSRKHTPRAVNTTAYGVCLRL